jgi:hypothetical protein
MAPCAAARRHHQTVLALALAVVGLSLILSTVDDRRIAFAGLTRFPLPDICQSRIWLRLDCPGCGLTRSFVHFFHGRWSESLRTHRLGWLLAVCTALQIPYRLVALQTPNGLPLGKTFPRAIGYGLAALLVVNWLLKLAGV